MTARTFDRVPVESDTHILSRLEARFDDYPVLHQVWFWEGIRAETLVFHASDVAALDDAALRALVFGSPLVKPGSRMTLSRGEDYTFVNFNFVLPDDD